MWLRHLAWILPPPHPSIPPFLSQNFSAPVLRHVGINHGDSGIMLLCYSGGGVDMLHLDGFTG